jgi:hypothetical protein
LWYISQIAWWAGYHGFHRDLDRLLFRWVRGGAKVAPDSYGRIDV